MTWETTSAKSVHKFSCRFLIYMSTEQEREYTLSVMHVTEFTTQQDTRCRDVRISRKSMMLGLLVLHRKSGMMESPDRRSHENKLTERKRSTTEVEP